jgi:hypothetical protein
VASNRSRLIELLTKEVRAVPVEVKSSFFSMDWRFMLKGISCSRRMRRCLVRKRSPWSWFFHLSPSGRESKRKTERSGEIVHSVHYLLTPVAPTVKDWMQRVMDRLAISSKIGGLTVPYKSDKRAKVCFRGGYHVADMIPASLVC